MADKTPVGTESTAASAASSEAGKPTPRPDLSKLTLAELDTIMTGGTVEVPVVGAEGGSQEEKKDGEEPPAKPEGEQKPDGEQKADGDKPDGEEEGKAAIVEGAKPEGDDDDKGEEDEDAKPRGKGEEKRIRLSNPMDRAIASVKKAHDEAGTPITWAEAEAKVVGEKKAPAPVTVNIDETPKVVAAVELVTTLETEIKALEDKIEKAGENEDVFSVDIAKATTELGRKQRALAKAERAVDDARLETSIEMDEAAKTKAAHEAARKEWRMKAIEEYPDVADTTTPLGKAVAAQIAALKDPAHPDHPILWADSVAYRVTVDKAKELGIAPKTTTPAAAAETKTAVPAKEKVVSPPSGAKGTVKSETTPEDASKKTVEFLKSDKATLQDLDAAFGAGGPLLVIR